MEFTVSISKSLWEQLQAEALKRGTTAEELTAVSIKNYTERIGDYNAE